jgi:hypothetical protein
MSLAQGVLLVRGEDNGSATFAMTNATQRAKAERYPSLVFNRYGDQYFLSQVWPAGQDDGRVLTRSKVEEELASRSGKPEVVALLVSGSRSRRPAR